MINDKKAGYLDRSILSFLMGKGRVRNPIPNISEILSKRLYPISNLLNILTLQIIIIDFIIYVNYKDGEVDVFMELKKLVYVSMFATIMGVLGVIPPIFLGITPVPITLQTLGVMLSGCVLGAKFGPKYGALSQLLFLALVFAGLPMLSGGRGGIGVLFGPSGGYLIGWVAGAYVIGLLAYRMKDNSIMKAAFANLIGGIFVVYLFGIPFQAFMMNISVQDAIVLSLVYLPGDFIKLAIASFVAVKLRNAAPFRKEVSA